MASKTMAQYRDEVRRVAGYDPLWSGGWGASPGASSVQLTIADSAVPGFPAISVEEAERLSGRRVSRILDLGRYTKVCLGWAYPADPEADDVSSMDD